MEINNSTKYQLKNNIMPAYKYYSENNRNPYFQSSLKPQMGKKYYYRGRLYCQSKENNELFYTDIRYDLNLSLQSWTTSSIDMEIEIKNISIAEEYRLAPNQCDSIVEEIENLTNIAFFVRINSAGNILRLFNVPDLMAVLPQISNEQKGIKLLESNPLISAFLSGFVDETTKAIKPFRSHILLTLTGSIDLKMESKKLKHNKAKEIFITDRKIAFDANEQADMPNSKHRLATMADNTAYSYSTLITVHKAVDKLLPYSITYSTEESLSTTNNVFISVGLEKTILTKELGLATKLSNILCKSISAIF